MIKTAGYALAPISLVLPCLSTHYIYYDDEDPYFGRRYDPDPSVMASR